MQKIGFERDRERELERAENEPQRKTEDSAFFAEPNLAEYSLNKASHWLLRTPGAAVIRTLRHRQIPTYGLSWFAWKSKHCTRSEEATTEKEETLWCSIFSISTPSTEKYMNTRQSFFITVLAVPNDNEKKPETTQTQPDTSGGLRLY